ncbi:MAG: lysM domain protein [Gammaproteobacteria bacterium]|jgi:lipoprotein NlpD|nr:lysM domain protein [Gammaproteobacteria bacterium]
MAHATLNKLSCLLLQKIILAGSVVILTACSSGTTAPVVNSWNSIDTTQTFHKVQAGETIYSIAWRYNVSDEDLIRWNNLQKPYYVRIGQSIRLTPPPGASTAATSTSTAQTIEPVPTFSPEQTSANNTSLASKKTTSTKPAVTTSNAKTASQSTAAAPVEGSGGWSWPVKGKVEEAYGQNGNKGLDIATPENTPVKAVQPGTVVYAGNSLRGYGNLTIIKQKGDIMTAYAQNSKLMIKEGQKVSSGQTIALSGRSLHFEVRKAGKPVDPLNYLAKEQA